MKRWITLFLIAIGLLFVTCILMVSSLLPNEYEVLVSNWGIELPKANETQHLLIKDNNFHGDGESFTLFTYAEAIDLGERGFTKLTFNDVANANGRIAQFQRKTIDVRQNDAEVIAIFTNNAVEAEIGDYFYHDARNAGYDTIALLYKPQSQQLYLYEWHQ